MSIYNKNNRYCSIIRYYAIFHKSYDMSSHSHDGCEIMYVSSGECKIEINSAIYILKENEFVFIDEYIPHSLYVEPNKGCKMLNIEFACNNHNKDFAMDIDSLAEQDKSFSKFINRGEDVFFSSDNNGLGVALKDLILEITKNSVNTYMTKIMMERVFIELGRCEVKINKGYTYVNKAFKFIQSNYYEDLNVMIIAKEAQINKSYLQELFNEVFGCSVMEYVGRVRLDYAKRLLINTDKPVTDIGFDIGFNSRQNFALSFKRSFKISPMQFRKLYKLGEDIDENAVIESNGQSRRHIQL